MPFAASKLLRLTEFLAGLRGARPERGAARQGKGPRTKTVGGNQPFPHSSKERPAAQSSLLAVLHHHSPQSDPEGIFVTMST